MLKLKRSIVYLDLGCIFDKEIKTKKKEIMTRLEIKVAKLQKGYDVWYTLNPIERWEKVMVNFTPAERKGVNGLRRMAKYIIDNEIN